MLVDYWYCRKTRVDENLQNNRNHFKSKEYMCKNFDKNLQQLNQCIPSKIINEQEECQKVMMVNFVVTHCYSIVKIHPRICTKVV